MLRGDRGIELGTLPGAALAGLLGAGALLGHLDLETVEIDVMAALLRDLASQLEREAVGVVQQERDRTGDRGTGVEAVELRVEQGGARTKGRAEPLLFTGDDRANEVLLLDEFGIRLAHDLDGRVDECRCHEVRDVEQVGLAHGAADDATEHVPAALVRGEHTVTYEEGHRAGMLREDAQ